MTIHTTAMIKKGSPRIILLVGPPACGKSLFSKHFRKTFPDYEAIDDRYLVEEYLLRNKVMEINHPQVWDDIIIQLARDLDPQKNYIVEFARGHDPNYLQAFSISPKDVYPRTVGLACSAMHPDLASSIGIVHIFCNYQLRFTRNARRRNVTGQDLPDFVMERVFKEEIFMPKYIGRPSGKLRKGVFNGSLPVVTIDNSEEITRRILQKHFESLSKKTMDMLINNLLTNNKGEKNADNERNSRCSHCKIFEGAGDN